MASKDGREFPFYHWREEFRNRGSRFLRGSVGCSPDGGERLRAGTLLYDIQFWTRSESQTLACLVCDEAHLYLPIRSDANAAEKRALETIERIAKEGRK